VGQWEIKGTIQFDAVRVTPVLPVHKLIGDLLFGEGETIRSRQYTFSGNFSGDGGNYHRTLHNATATFNTDRWCFGPGNQVTYRFKLLDCTFRSASLSFNVNYHVRGECVAEASRDEKAWRRLAVQKGLGTARASLPADLLPAETIYLRLSAGPENSFQVNQVEFQAELNGGTDDAGRTLFADVLSAASGLAIERMAMDEPVSGGKIHMRILMKNEDVVPIGPLFITADAYPREQTTDTTVGPRDTGTVSKFEPGERKVALLNLWLKPGSDSKISLRAIGAKEGQETRIELKINVPAYYRTGYGHRIAGVSLDKGLWWCESTHKVPRQCVLPNGFTYAAQLSAARNDHEAVQVVLMPDLPLKGLIATAGPLRQVENLPHGGQAGRLPYEIPADNIRISRVAYHFVHHPTDKTGVADWWPDALPPLTKPIDLPAGKNQPLWVLVYVPKDAKPGDYTGEIKLKAEGWQATVPLKLHVWNFTLPDRNHVETALGLEPHMIFRYHQLKTEADKRRVLDMYLQSFAEHRISTYEPVPLDPIEVKFDPAAKPQPTATVDFSKFDLAMQRAIDKFHFSNFKVNLEAMGGGTFHERYEPSIGSFKENTPEYQAMFSSYMKQIEDHLRAKGWDKMAYTYWFDEPDVKDYAFVRAGMERIKKYAPGIQTMITKQPEDAMAGAVDIWCMLTPEYNRDKMERRRAKGERFWWYVCCGPKEPYCTLFIDHPATELRVWLWQTWQRNISGILIWSTNYWTSDTAFPDRPQNPYEDPMGYVSGYGVPKGTKQYWGNGDGRFIYPPESAAAPGTSGPGPVLDPPVSSIRWEMLREGIEDYEFLYLLRERLNKHRSKLKPEEAARYEALLEVPAEITRDLTTFATDPSPIYARRAAIAEAIERLGE
jgi:hypothetical protein